MSCVALYKGLYLNFYKLLYVTVINHICSNSLSMVEWHRKNTHLPSRLKGLSSLSWDTPTRITAGPLHTCHRLQGFQTQGNNWLIEHLSVLWCLFFSCRNHVNPQIILPAEMK